MIPNVYMTWCYRQAICPWCNLPILVRTPEVNVFFWNKGNPERRGYNYKKHYHPDCWVAQGLDYLRMNPYIPRKGAKPRLTKLTPEQKRKRYLLLRKKASLEQRKREIKAPYPDRLLIETRLDIQIIDVILDISRVGGIPKGWMECLIRET